jgi:hypothetical protein
MLLPDEPGSVALTFMAGAGVAAGVASKRFSAARCASHSLMIVCSPIEYFAN